MVNKAAILDTGALVAFLSRGDRFHLWAVATFKKLPPTLLTCESVLSELFFLLRKDSHGIELALQIVRQGLLSLCSISEDFERVLELMHKYSNVPMSFADACLVCMAEDFETGDILTLDSDFEVYRWSSRKAFTILVDFTEASDK